MIDKALWQQFADCYPKQKKFQLGKLHLNHYTFEYVVRRRKLHLVSVFDDFKILKEPEQKRIFASFRTYTDMLEHLRKEYYMGQLEQIETWKRDTLTELMARPRKQHSSWDPGIHHTSKTFKTPIGIVTVFIDRTGSKQHPLHTTLALGSYSIDEPELARLLALGQSVDPMRVHHPDETFDRLGAFRAALIGMDLAAREDMAAINGKAVEEK